MKSASACTLTTGVAMWAPRRYTRSKRNVTENFSQRSSGSLNTFNQLGSRNAICRSALDGSPRLLDLRAGGGGHRDALHHELAAHISHAEQLDRVIGSTHEPGPNQRIARDLDSPAEFLELAHVHDLRRLLEGIGEPPLRTAADQGHLPALEA